MTPLKSRKTEATTVSTTEIVENVPLPPRQDSHPLDRVFGIFKDEPLMDALMERVHEDRRAECEAGTAE